MRAGAGLCTALLHLLLAWLLLSESGTEAAAERSAEGLTTTVTLLAAPATPRALPEPVQAPSLRPPRIELPDTRLNLATPDSATPAASAETAMSAAAATPAAAPGQSASTAPRVVASVDCLPLRWLQGVSRRISFELNYPSQERALKHRGTAYVRVSVSRSGVVLDAPLLRGSGHRALDLEAQAVFRRIGRFTPVPPDACKGADIVVIDQPILFGVEQF